ncbi:DUF1876 domain-containing protein [Streptomyces albipurpureus]|uniref:DUF1876 domain-containing protein n=1 Tax=Streptomyces albipurpureus TaxID=2897419 RepID=A0ABT0UM34_9ACTN|nr:DUF1876 domain-containing protein [Streptomyces sp. CWNU-1]MCM2389327.1 DUF1876 domain-containing protein [Streptomyces sp. CWNU-1]
MTRTLEWKVNLTLSEGEGTTKARAVLDTGSGRLTGRGAARRSPTDADIPEIGDELAAARAMRDLSGQLMRAADRDLEAMGAGPPVAPGVPDTGWSPASG